MSKLKREPASALFRYLENYHRISLAEACQIGIGEGDTIGIWAKMDGRWRHFTRAQQTKKLKKYQRGQSACGSIVMDFFGLNRYQYEKIRDSFEHADRKSWAGIYRANEDHTDGPEFAIVVELPDYRQELAVGVGAGAAVLAGVGLNRAFGKEKPPGPKSLFQTWREKTGFDPRQPLGGLALTQGLQWLGRKLAGPSATEIGVASILSATVAAASKPPNKPPPDTSKDTSDKTPKEPSDKPSDKPSKETSDKTPKTAKTSDKTSDETSDKTPKETLPGTSGKTQGTETKTTHEIETKKAEVKKELAPQQTGSEALRVNNEATLQIGNLTDWGVSPPDPTNQIWPGVYERRYNLTPDADWEDYGVAPDPDLQHRWGIGTAGQTLGVNATNATNAPLFVHGFETFNGSLSNNLLGGS